MKLHDKLLIGVLLFVVFLSIVLILSVNKESKTIETVQCFEIHYPSRIDTLCFKSKYDLEVSSYKGSNKIGQYFKSTAPINKIK